MNTIQISNMRQKTSILDKSISKGKGEINLNCFALMFSELVQYCQGKAHTVNELQTKYVLKKCCALFMVYFRLLMHYIVLDCQI